jgi:hypothetical protein
MLLEDEQPLLLLKDQQTRQPAKAAGPPLTSATRRSSQRPSIAPLLTSP